MRVSAGRGAMAAATEVFMDTTNWLLSLRTVEEAWESVAKKLLISREINIVSAWMLARLRKRGFPAAAGWAALIAYRKEIAALMPGDPRR